MKIKIADLHQKITNYLQQVGLNDHDAKTLTELVIEQEMVGNRFSAVGDLAGKKKKHVQQAQEEVVAEKAAMKLIKGNGRSAPLITADHLDEVIAKAKSQGIFALGIYDSTYNEFFDVFCRRIAAQDCIGIIFENGGPQGVMVFGGKADITGTNPLAYGVPTHSYPMIFDGSTAAHAYGGIRKAKERGEKLPENAYVDKDYNMTTDPHQAIAVMPFGGFKGYAINLLADVLSGALVRGKCGLDQPLDSERYIGTLVLVIDPAAFGELKDFKDQTTKLAKDLMAVEPVDPSQPVRVPGWRGSERMEKFKAAGEVETEDVEWAKFERAGV